MTRMKLGLLGVCAMVFGLMAFSATAAQAETNAKWLFAEKGAGTNLVPFLSATIQLEKESPTLVLHSEILKIKVLFVCTALKAVEAKLLAKGSIGKEEGVVSGSKVLFSGCTTELNNVVAPECTPKDAVDGAGTIVTQPGHALLVLGAAGEDLVKILPDSAVEHAPFAIIELPAGCPIGTKVPVIGKLNLKDCQNLALTHLVKHLVEEGPGSGLFTISLTVEHKATLLGSAWAFLTGNHELLKFSGDPE